MHPETLQHLVVGDVARPVRLLDELGEALVTDLRVAVLGRRRLGFAVQKGNVRNVPVFIWVCAAFQKGNRGLSFPF
jgi:hypothetical protein